MAQVVTQLIVDSSGAKTGVAEFTAQMDKAKKAAVEAGDATATSFERAQAKWTASLAKTDPVIKAQIAMEKDLARQREIGANAVKLGIATQDAAAAQVAKLAQQHQTYIATLTGASKATTELANAHKGLDAQGQAAFHSIRSVGEQIALGVSPVQALTGQINHLTFAASGQGGLAGAFGQVATLARGMINPMTIAIGVTTALTAAAATLAVQYDKVQVSSRGALLGAGERTGTTVSDLNQFTKQNSSPLGMSNDEARALGEAFTKSGDITIAKLHNVNDALIGFANQTGKSVSDAAKDFEKFGSDPKKALEELGGVFGPVEEHVRNLVDLQSLALDKTSAFNTVLDAYAKKLKEAADNSTFLEKASRFFQTAWGAPKGLKPSGPEDQLEATRGQLNAAIDRGASSNPIDRGFAAGEVEELSRKFEELQQKREAAIGETAKAQLNALNTEAGRASQQVAAIGKAWGDVSLPVALQLQAMQNMLPVAEAWTNATRMRAQEEATYLSLIQKGKSEEEASAVAAKEYELSKAAAVASAQKLVQSSEDNLDKIKAQGTEMEGVVASSIAYRDAIQAGATQTQAAAIAANTLAANMAQAAKAAQQIEQANINRQIDQNNFTTDGIVTAAQLNARVSQSQFSPGPHTYVLADDAVQTILKMQASEESAGISGLAGNAYPGGIAAAFNAIRTAPNSFGISDVMQKVFAQPHGQLGIKYDAQGIVGNERSTINDKISSYDTLVQLQNAQTNDKGTQVANLKAEMDWLQTLPETISRDQKIVNLQQSIDSLKNATDANTAATSATLNPLYSQGHGALAIGYYKAAAGLDMIAHGPTSGDQVPFHAMVNGGERVTIQTPAQQRAGNNDNSRTVVNNNSFVFNNTNTGNARRSQRQFAQGFGQMAAANS